MHGLGPFSPSKCLSGPDVEGAAEVEAVLDEWDEMLSFKQIPSTDGHMPGLFPLPSISNSVKLAVTLVSELNQI